MGNTEPNREVCPENCTINGTNGVTNDFYDKLVTSMEQAIEAKNQKSYGEKTLKSLLEENEKASTIFLLAVSRLTDEKLLTPDEIKASYKIYEMAKIYMEMLPRTTMELNVRWID